MNDTNWQRVDYTNWDEAFRGLAPAVRQQSVRVAGYTRELYVTACSTDFYKKSSAWRGRIKGQYADTAYKCGLYHQLGKALVPPEYQIWQDGFTEEEVAVYRKYTVSGRQLVASLQNRSAKDKEKRTGALPETETKNIPWLMQREACEQHMERFNGSGYPAGLSGDDISPIAQIVGFAKELDRLSAEIKSEAPFDEAVEILLAQSGIYWSNQLIEIFKKSIEKCREVYEKYIHYTLTVPKTIPLVDKREGRALGLEYRPMISDNIGTISAYEAIPWFSGIAGNPTETEAFPDVSELLHRTGLVNDVIFYFLYEATDTLLRMKNCRLQVDTLLFKMPKDFYTAGSMLKKLDEVFKNQNVPKEKLLLTIPENVIANANKGVTETISRYVKHGYILVADDCHLSEVSADKLNALGINHIRLSADLIGKKPAADTVYIMMKDGFKLIGGSADSSEALTWLLNCGASLVSGTVTGGMVNEENLIRDVLQKERI